MCDHCRTYKPLIDGTYYERETVPVASPWVRPQINSMPRSSACAGVCASASPSPSDKGCCSWRESCCNGGCCSQVGNCCSTEPEAQDRPGVNAKAPTGYGYGYGYGQFESRMGLPAMTNFPPGMPDYAGPDKVPCATQEKKLPMCFGGDCNDSSSETREAESAEIEETTCVSMPRESER